MGLESYRYEPEAQMASSDAGSLFDLAEPTNSFEAYQMYNPRMRR